MDVLFAILVAPVRAVIVLLTFALVSEIAMTYLKDNKPSFDPFVPYADVLPKQSRSAVLQRGFKCNQIIPSLDEVCSLPSETGIFSEIQVRFISATHRDQVSQTVFKPREGAITIGDLEMLWGRPEIKVFGQTVNLRWRKRSIVAIPQSKRVPLSYWDPVTYIAFETSK